MTPGPRPRARRWRRSPGRGQRRRRSAVVARLGRPRRLGGHVRAARPRAGKAMTFCAQAASSRPSPKPGVGKWLAGTPMLAWRLVLPVAGSSPYSLPSCPIVQTSPAARIGGPPPVPDFQSSRSRGGDLAARTAMMPRQARQVHGRAGDRDAAVDVGVARRRSTACWPPIPPRRAPSSRNTRPDFPACHDLPVGEQRGRGGQVDVAGVVGAATTPGRSTAAACSDGDSWRVPSLLS